MEPLDLTQAPPRSPHATLDGLAMLPRTIDKIRATLPGGNPGVYKIAGFSQGLLDGIGVSEEQLRQAVASAQTEDDVVAWLRAHANTGAYAELSEKMRQRSIDDVADKKAFVEERYPILKGRPDIHRLFDVLDADDAEMFAAP